MRGRKNKLIASCLAANISHGWRLTAYSTTSYGERSSAENRPSRAIHSRRPVGRERAFGTSRHRPLIHTADTHPDPAEDRGRARRMTSRSGDGNHARYQHAGVCIRAYRVLETDSHSVGKHCRGGGFPCRFQAYGTGARCWPSPAMSQSHRELAWQSHG